ncbi:TonB-dependent siderophore receptor [Aliarcobacter vitoriensis]|uniref:TonB-dependent siderophore receptor n=1 Tax=Aliarcobacter vitoriensis TaxID=2011099 RepID=UPI003AB0CB8F
MEEDSIIYIIEKPKYQNFGNTTVLDEISVNSANYKNGSAESGYLVEETSDIGPWRGKSLQDTPLSINVITEDLFENTVSNIDQIFKINPIIQLNSTQENSGSFGTSSIKIRGFNSGENQIIDGIPMGYVRSSTTDDLERIEILSGLSGFLYGLSPHVGGSVNYVLKRPTYERLTNLTIGNYGKEQYFAHLDLGDKIDEEGKFAYRLNVSHQNGETSIQDQNIEKTLISGALDLNISDEFLLQFDASLKKNKIDKVTGYISSNQSAHNFDVKEGYSPNWTFSDTTQNRFGTKALWQINDFVKFRAGYTYLETEYDQSLPFSYDNYNGTYRFTYYRYYPIEEKKHGTYVYSDIDFETFNLSHKLTLGVTGYKDKSHRREGALEWVTLGNNYTLEQLNDISKPIYKRNSNGKKYISSESEKKNILIGDEIAFNEQWSALIGANYVEVESHSYNITGKETAYYDSDAITPTFSLIYKPIEDLTTYITYMESLENGTVVSSIYSNAGEILEPLVSKQYEVGVKYSVSENLLLSSALFRIEKSNQYSDNATPQPKYVQDGEQIHQGLELTATGKVTDNLTLIAGGTIMDIEIEKSNNKLLEGKEPTGTATKMAKLYTEYNIPMLKGLTISGGAYYTGKSYRDSENTDIIPSYTIYDVGLRYKTKLDKYPTTFNLNVQNLTGKEYWSSFYSLGEAKNIAFSMKMEF